MKSGLIINYKIPLDKTWLCLIPCDTCFGHILTIFRHYLKPRWTYIEIFCILWRRFKSGGGGCPQPNLFLPKNIFRYWVEEGQIKITGLWVGERSVCTHVKDWSKSHFPLFVIWLLREVSRTRGQFWPPPLSNVISQATTMIVMSDEFYKCHHSGALHILCVLLNLLFCY